MVTFDNGGQMLVDNNITANGINRKAFYIDSAAPTFLVDGLQAPFTNLQWLDTTTTPATHKVYNGSAWVGPTFAHAMMVRGSQTNGNGGIGFDILNEQSNDGRFRFRYGEDSGIGYISVNGMSADIGTRGSNFTLDYVSRDGWVFLFGAAASAADSFIEYNRANAGANPRTPYTIFRVTGESKVFVGGSGGHVRQYLYTDAAGTAWLGDTSMSMNVQTNLLLQSGYLIGFANTKLKEVDVNTIAVRNSADNTYKNFWVEIITANSAVYTVEFRTISGDAMITFDDVANTINLNNRALNNVLIAGGLAFTSTGYANFSGGTGGGAGEYWVGKGGQFGGSLAFNAPTNSGFEFDINNVNIWAADVDGIRIKSGKEFRWYDSDNSNYVGFKAPALSANKIWTLPSADGSAGQILKTDGAGLLSFTSDLPDGVVLVNPIVHSPARKHYYWGPVDGVHSETLINGATITQGSDVLTVSTGNTLNAEATLLLSPLFRRGRKFEAYFAIRQGGDITNIGIQVGFTNTLGEISTNAAHHATVRFVPGESANWRCVTGDGDGSSQTITDSGVALAQNTEYFIEIRNDETKIEFWINGVLVATHTTDLPGTSTDLTPHVFLENTAAQTKSLTYHYAEAYEDVT